MPRDQDVRRCFQSLSKHFEADDVYAEFQEEDAEGRGRLKLKHFVQALSSLLGNYSSIDVNRVAKAFERSSKMVNYTEFCHELQQYMEEHAKSKGESSDGPTTAGKSRQTGRQSCSTDAATDDQSESSDHSRSRTGKSKRAADSDDLTKRTIRVDHRLEQHRVLKSSIRQKILRGVRKPAKGGFDGVRDLLLTQDSAGDGTLDESVFVDALLGHMKARPTQKEMAYLTANLRNKRHPSRINYEQIGHFLSVDSEEEASTSGDDDRNDVAATPSARPRAWGPPSPANKRQLDRPHLGSDVLTVERNLKQFMTQRVPKGGVTATCCHVPKSIFTGAEKFVEACELYDPLETGGLSEDGYEKVLGFCGVAVTPAQLRSVLSKFTRTSQGLVGIAAFLERYDQHLATVKHRQHLKTILQRLATDPDRDNAALLAHFRHQLEKLDARVTGVPTGVVSKKDFLACLTSHHSPMRWPKQDTEACLALFIDPSKASKHKDIRVVHYPEFLRMFQELCMSSKPDGVPCHCAENLSNVSNMDAIHQKLSDFLHDESRGVGTRGRDIAEHAFEAADKMRHGVSAAGYLDERDFFTVLRSIGMGVSPAEKQLILHALAQAGYISIEGVQYLAFLRLFDATPPNSSSRRRRNPPASIVFQSSSLGNMCVGAYLAEHATAAERGHFDAIMTTLKDLPPGEAIESTDQLVYHLGPTLKVSVQFFT
ncbi:hypothetical protein H257_06758 [Aphanomyces astaci]|uniref:EF-hand domain-containing protein n=1 Tax=Aphanomyces astaci TaxID=112090 RepID=W4GLE2_APHAT|nr:hypothetical protein H257_06758 [Aphanomyces astaci]ETV80487.1 hypothetical protein H257_06758 [Aphanomyces astaci]|eukprot:XP_009830411.1 hypothetical protein H257_06758 [Aphanomyces astaci]